jgi:hypothetical protein
LRLYSADGRMIDERWAAVEWESAGETEVLENAYTSATLVTTYLIWSVLGLNPERRGGKATSKRMNSETGSWDSSVGIETGYMPDGPFTSVNFNNQIIRHHIPEDSILHCHCCENLTKSSLLCLWKGETGSSSWNVCLLLRMIINPRMSSYLCADAFVFLLQATVI